MSSSRPLIYLSCLGFSIFNGVSLPLGLCYMLYQPSMTVLSIASFLTFILYCVCGPGLGHPHNTSTHS